MCCVSVCVHMCACVCVCVCVCVCFPPDPRVIPHFAQQAARWRRKFYCGPAAPAAALAGVVPAAHMHAGALRHARVITAFTATAASAAVPAQPSAADLFDAMHQLPAARDQQQLPAAAGVPADRGITRQHPSVSVCLSSLSLCPSVSLCLSVCSLCLSQSLCLPVQYVSV
jgi:hypothetical protein